MASGCHPNTSWNTKEKYAYFGHGTVIAYVAVSSIFDSLDIDLDA